MPKSFSQSVRRQVCARLRAGEPVAEIATETGISPATLFRWKAQALVDAGAQRRSAAPGLFRRAGEVDECGAGGVGLQRGDSRLR